MCKQNPLTRIEYQWETCTGAVAHKFSVLQNANDWMTNHLNSGKHEHFYKSLQLVKVETVIKETVLVKSINPM